MPERGSPNLTRQELYDRIWATPVLKLATEFGISNVALAKRCKKLNIPLPPRGYWAKLAVGEAVNKTPLPPDPRPEGVVLVDSGGASIKPSTLPNNNRALNSFAAELLTTLRAATAQDHDHGRVSSQGPLLPQVTVSKPLIERAARALHVIIEGAAARGVTFRKARSKYDRAYFELKHARLSLAIEEQIVTIRHQPSEQDKRKPKWEWSTQSRELAGKLTFKIGNHDNYRFEEVKHWTEGNDGLTDGFLGEVIQGICQYYLDLEKQRLEWAEANRKAQEKRQREQVEEERKAHEKALRDTSSKRFNDLIKAAEWHRIHAVTVEFIRAIERRWQEAQSGQLTSDQYAWMEWALEQARQLSPFESGYPDPSQDGPFQAQSVPLGGPYPPNRDFPRPPTMPRIPPPVAESSRHHEFHSPPQQPYPFWLKHRGR